jgi:hypothetical protein
MGGHDVTDTALGVVSREWRVEVAGELEDCGYAPSEGLDGAMDFEKGIIVYDGAFRTIFLVGEGEGCCFCREKACGASVEGEDLSVLPEFHVADTKLFGTAFGSSASVGVFADSEEVIECRVGKVADSLGFGGGGAEAFVGTPTWHCDGDGKFGLWNWVRSPIAFDLLL